MRIALFLGAGLASGVALVGAYSVHALRTTELQSIDTRFSIRGSLPAPKRVVVVAIDAKSFDALQAAHLDNRWPWPRRDHARLLDRIAAGHPKAIAFDVQFTEPSDARDDNALITAVERAGHVVLATTEVDAHGGTNIFGGESVLKQIGAEPGNASLQTDADGVIRSVPSSLDGLTSFGLVAASVAAGGPIRMPGGATTEPIDFAGPPGTVPTYSYSDVLFGKVPPSVFKDKLVVIGPSAPSLQDVHATSASGSELMPGAEIQANIANTALADFPLRFAGRGVGVFLILLFGLFPAAASLRLRPTFTAASVVALAAAYLALAQVAFDHGRILLVTYPLGALALATVACLLIWYVLEAIQRAHTRDTFARFVPAAVVDQVLARTNEKLRLGGEQMFGTVMFTDLRGFTTFSESLEASQVIGFLNRYLAQMSDAVLAHGGTLVSYTGDGMMAVFGAPLEQADHADRAVAAAREMLEERLPAFNEWLRSQGFDLPFKMGIGLNTGMFMSGNVGSEQRLEYTAIGDTINTASRIEGLTKGTPYPLFVADSTRQALTGDASALHFVDELPIRGRQGTIKVWTLADTSVLKPGWETEVAAPEAVAPESAPAPAPA